MQIVRVHIANFRSVRQADIMTIHKGKGKEFDEVIYSKVGTNDTCQRTVAIGSARPGSISMSLRPGPSEAWS